MVSAHGDRTLRGEQESGGSTGVSHHGLPQACRGGLAPLLTPSRTAKEGALEALGKRDERGGSSLDPPLSLIHRCPTGQENPPRGWAGRRTGSDAYRTLTVVLTVPPFTDE